MALLMNFACFLRPDCDVCLPLASEKAIRARARFALSVPSAVAASWYVPLSPNLLANLKSLITSCVACFIR